MAVARRYWEMAGVGHKVCERLGNATESLNRLLLEEGPGSFDLAFIDADKRQYWRYYEQLLVGDRDCFKSLVPSQWTRPCTISIGAY